MRPWLPPFRRKGESNCVKLNARSDPSELNAGSIIVTARGCQSASIVHGRITMKYIMASLTTASCLLLVAAGTAFAAGQPTKPSVQPTTGQPGASAGNTCGGMGSVGTPGAAVSAQGSVFNPNGTAGGVYAGNPNTASLANANSTAAVSQYDRACFQIP
jgi:hypothetical protein